jgi:heme/copper-type cytochrome/quinol oxidase subunit 2
MKISIKDYNLQNIMFVHNFVLIFLIFVLLFVSTYLVLTIVFFNNESVFMRMKHKFTYSFIKNKMFNIKHIKLIMKNVSFLKNSLKKKKILKFHKNMFITHNISLEIIWTIIPILIILEMIFPSLSLIADDEIDHKGSLYTVGVIGNQWYWNYELNLALGVVKYVSNLVLLEEFNSEHKNLSRLLATTKTLPIAVGIKTSFYITSNDVAHSWALPSLGIKVDAIPGRINLKTIIASRLGLYSGMCSELCGIEHGFMPISVQVLTFSNWWYNIKDSLEEINSKKIFYINDIWYINK